MPKRKHKGYLHGYSKKEQNRLYKQARFLAPEVYEKIDMKGVRRLIEVGCGVGAQTSLLVKRYPRMKITGIDLSEVQIAQATRHLQRYVKKHQVHFSVQNAEKINFPKNSFDGAFLCWFLEHVPRPDKVLKQVRNVLKPGGVVYCTEVQNHTFFAEPYSPAILKYWFIFNDAQWLMGGDPFMGAKLGNILKQAGFKKIHLEFKFILCDSRNIRRRSAFLNDWTALMLSAAPELLKKKRITPKLISEVKKEIAILKKTKDSVFSFGWIQTRAEK